eukprot:gene48401-11339_t
MTGAGPPPDAAHPGEGGDGGIGARLASGLMEQLSTSVDAEDSEQLRELRESLHAFYPGWCAGYPSAGDRVGMLDWGAALCDLTSAAFDTNDIDTA